MVLSGDKVLVCNDWHRPLKGGGTQPGFSMHTSLKENLDLMLKHSKKDWDFVMIVSGHGQVRVGKSVLAQQIGKYLSYHSGTPWGIDNIVFESNKLVDVAKKLPKHSVIVYDEAREGLNSARVMSNLTQNLLTFFTECGQLNHFFILVLPDFFDLPKSIAVTRSTCLIDVLWKGEFERGHFCFYNANQKRMLYFNGRRYQNYGVQKPSFYGKFFNIHTVGEDDYRSKKLGMLNRAVADGSERGDVIKNRLLMGLLWKYYGEPSAPALVNKLRVDSEGLIDVSKKTGQRAIRDFKALRDRGKGSAPLSDGSDSALQTNSFT